jgi:hypothetical protein
LSLLELPPPTNTVGQFTFKPTAPPVERDERRAKALHAFLRASETRARVQKLARRAPELMQINIAAHQVNVAQNQG